MTGLGTRYCLFLFFRAPTFSFWLYPNAVGDFPSRIPYLAFIRTPPVYSRPVPFAYSRQLLRYSRLLPKIFPSPICFLFAHPPTIAAIPGTRVSHCPDIPRRLERPSSEDRWYGFVTTPLTPDSELAHYPPQPPATSPVNTTNEEAEPSQIRGTCSLSWILYRSDSLIKEGRSFQKVTSGNFGPTNALQ